MRLEPGQLEELQVVEVLNTEVIFCHQKFLEMRQQEQRHKKKKASTMVYCEKEGNSK